MSGRLWKCSKEQLRPASSEEELSAEIAQVLSQEALQEVIDGRSNDYLDVSEDGHPPEEAGSGAASIAPSTATTTPAWTIRMRHST